MSITGNLRTLEFAELLQWLSQGQKTGCLVVKNATTEKRIYFKGGKIVSSESNNPNEHLGKYMVREGLLDQETLSRAVKLQASTQILLGKVLVTLGTITEEELLRILRQKTEESLYELFNWTEGDFRFLPDELPRLPMVPLEIDVTNVVLEGAKRLDEARRDRLEGEQEESYSDEVETVLSSTVFQGIDVDDVEATAQTLDQEPAASVDMPPAAAALEPTYQDPVSDASRGYYGGAARGSKSRTPLWAAAAALVAIVIGVVAYLAMRPDPTSTPAERDSATAGVEASAPGRVRFEVPERPNNLAHQAAVDAAPSNSLGTDDGLGRDAIAKQEIQARYEAELETLKRQLAQAQLAAAERDQALDRLAELEEQVAQAEEPITDGVVTETDAVAALEPKARFTVASLQSPLESEAFSAGGDEPPPFVPPQPTTEADQEAGTDFAADMVESAAPDRSLLQQLTPPKNPLETDADPPGQDAVIDLTTAQVRPPVLLSGPAPRYPAAARRLGKEAVVTLRLLIDERGEVVDIERVGPAQGLGFDNSAINAARASTWQPGTRDGQPAVMWAEIRISFKP